ncbi:MAG: hypothetical protein ACM3ZO_10660, partial [Clostridia bacterium]
TRAKTVSAPRVPGAGSVGLHAGDPWVRGRFWATLELDRIDSVMNSRVGWPGRGEPPKENHP